MKHRTLLFVVLAVVVSLMALICVEGELCIRQVGTEAS